MADFATLFAKLDKQASDRDADCPTGKCPRKTPGLIVMVAHADTTATVAGVEIDVSKPTSQKKSTDGDGLAKFTPAKLGSHVLRINLSKDLAKKYSPLASREISTTDGKTSTVLLLLQPLPSLDVVLQRSGGGSAIGGADVELSGPETLKQSTVQGVAKFAVLKPGRYDVKITLNKAHLEWAVAPALEKKVVVVGQANTLTVQVHPRGKVDPTIAIDDPKVVLVRRDYMANATSKATPHRLPVRLGVSAKFDGTGQLTCSLPAKISVFRAATGGTAVAFPITLSAGELNQGLSGQPFTLYIEGAAPSGAMNDVQLDFKLQGGTGTLGPPVTDKLTCVRLKIDICKWRVDAATDPVLIPEADKITKGRYIHVQNTDREHERAKLIIHKAEPAAFTGTLQVRVWDEGKAALGERLELFDAEAASQAPHPHPFSEANAAIPATGRVLWVQGQTVSQKMLDTSIRVGLTNLPDEGTNLVEGDRVTVTVLKTTLEIGQSRTKPDVDPAPMSAEDQIKKGRYLHTQDAGFHHGRAMVLVKKVEPAGFIGKLTLTVWDVTAKSNASPRVELFKAEEEIAKSGQSARANPYEFDHDAAFPAKGLKHWAEGKAAKVSAALRDTEIRLSIKDHLAVCGRAAVTVVEFTKIKVTIKSTPANTPRAGHAAPVNHTHEVTKYEEDFTDAGTLVLIRNAQPDIALEVTTKPDRPVDLPISWRAVRNKDDHASLGEAKKFPTVTPDAVDKRKAVLDANEKGSFHVRAYIDCNGVEGYSPLEPSFPLNLILANATVVRDNSAGIKANLRAAGVAGAVNVTNGTWPGTWAAATGAGGAGMTMELVADVTGGGKDGRLGLDKVFGGLVNMLRGNDIQLTYRDATGLAPVDYVIRNRYVRNKAAATGNYGGSKMFKPGDPAPNLLVFPVLDTGRSPGGLGGETAVMGRSGVWDPAPPNRPVGRQYKLRCIDSPGRGFLRAHPDHPSALLFQIHYVQQFRANFCFWTNVTVSRTQTGDPADRVYSALRTMNWDVTADWNVNSAAAVPVLTVTNPHVINVTGPATINPIGRAQDHGVEVRPPSGITDAIAWETT